MRQEERNVEKEEEKREEIVNKNPQLAEIEPARIGDILREIGEMETEDGMI
jgi:hypothetical protein